MGKQYLNGVLYGTGEIIKFSPYIYSLEEREVGVWTDGKPLYQKTVYINALPNTAYTATNYAHGISDIDIICFCKATAHWSNGAMTNLDHLALPSESISAIARPSIEITADRTNITFRCGMDRSALSAFVTLQYTKTTDTPGSGHYTTKGGEAHHYSTTEQVIGTWIDGKPLYEKTLNITTPSNYNTDSTVADISNLHISKLISLNGMVLERLPINSDIDNETYIRAWVTANKASLIMYISSTIRDQSGYIILQYTKTTD